MKKVYLFLISCIISTATFAQTQVTFYTNFGDFQAQIYDSLMPVTSTNFLNLVNTKFYDGLKFYRVVSNFVIQGGNETGNGNPIPDEFDSTGTLSNVKKTISMANAGPNTGSSEIFINLKNNTFLDYDKSPLSSAHPIFGLVHDGWNVVDSIGKTPSHPTSGRPFQDVIIDSVRITGSYLSIDVIDKYKIETQIYPNPVNLQSILDFYSAANDDVQIVVFDAIGREVLKKKIHVDAGKTKIPLTELGISSLSPGTYIFIALGKNQKFTEQLIIR